MTPGDVLEENSWITGCGSQIIDLEITKTEAYPNPFTDFATVGFEEEGVWSIYSTSGVLLDMGVSESRNSVEIGHTLAKGCFILQFTPKFEQNCYSKRIIKL
jgi:hypothetical protein